MSIPATPLEDLSDLLTASVRRVAELAADKGVSLFYDYRGPSFEAGAEGRALGRVMDTLIDDAIARLSSGCIFLSVDVVPHRVPGRSTVLLQIARTGLPASEQVVSRLISTTRPAPREARPGKADDSAESQARQACEEMGGSLIVGSLPGQAHVVRADMLLPAPNLTEDLTVAIEQGLAAWLIGEPPVVFESLVRRLHRLGWKVRVFPTVARARAHWRERQGHPPDLVVAMERYRVSPDELCVLADDLPATTAVFGALRPASLHRLDPLGFLGRVKAFTFPLSPRELHQITVCALAKVGKRLRMPTHATLALERRPRALLVEDNVINQLLCSEILQLFGFEVDIANNGLEAVRYCERELPAVVLMDLDMPVMDGLEATRRIRAMHQRGSLPYIPIVAATAKTTEDDRRQAREAGMDGFVPKPLDLGLMHSELQRVLEAPPASAAA